MRAATHIYALVLPNTVNLLKYFKNGFSCYFISQLRSVFGASAKFRHTLFTFLFKKTNVSGSGVGVYQEAIGNTIFGADQFKEKGKVLKAILCTHCSTDSHLVYNF